MKDCIDWAGIRAAIISRDFLNEVYPFRDEGEATVLGHMDRALDFLESNKGEHNLLLIKFGDWNDSLTGVGKEGRGESVWLSIAYAQALLEMAELAKYLNLLGGVYILDCLPYETIYKKIYDKAIEY